MSKHLLCYVIIGSRNIDKAKLDWSSNVSTSKYEGGLFWYFLIVSFSSNAVLPCGLLSTVPRKARRDFVPVCYYDAQNVITNLN